MASLKPLGSKVLIRRLEAEAKTPGGIVLPDAAKEKPKRGIVIGVGPGKVLDSGNRAEMQLQEGNEVVFTTYAGAEITINGEEFVIMEESDVLAIITK